ncbi:SDR family oxidoreductase [Marihabitans asiaticum]|uniref:Short-subunit dehydrogenase n=2 Tax=Marihabitans asiaticum TaxID=415218 RepID=A0A560WI35_9MICO|nr:short-subunit dehydrogenase [Marihabitans asiaticum]
MTAETDRSDQMSAAEVPSDPFAGRVAIVTGAAGGIGAALAAELLRRGARVVVSDVDAQRLEEQATELARDHEDRVAAISGDAASEDGIAAMITVARESFGPVDLYFANAGMGESLGLDAPEELWSTAIDLNLMAHVRAARALVPEWVERGEGYFVSTASAAGLLTQIGSATYTATKHAAVAFSEWLAVTYGAQGVGVSCLCPQGVDTRLLREGMNAAGGGAVATAAVASAGEILEPSVVARVTLDAVAERRFLVLPHPAVADYQRRKVDDIDRWIRGMQRFAASLGT